METINKNELTEDELRDKYNSWWDSRDTDTFDLHTRALELEAIFFHDLMLKSPELADYTAAYGGDGGIYDCADDLSLSLEGNQYTYHVQELEDCGGMCNGYDRSITISRECLFDDNTLIHEMIHAHENILDKKLPFMKEIIFLELYRKLLKENIDIDNRIKSHANLLSGIDISLRGGSHSVFFLLKSLEIDIRRNLKLGTTCGYGRELD